MLLLNNVILHSTKYVHIYPLNTTGSPARWRIVGKYTIFSLGALIEVCGKDIRFISGGN